MSGDDTAGRTAAGEAQPEREPLWAIGLSALLVAVSRARRHANRPLGQGERLRLDDRRDRSAEGPSEIPARGWTDILLRVYNSIPDDRILANAAGVTYYALLALFPGIAAAAQCRDPDLHDRDDSVPADCARLRRRFPGDAQSASYSGNHGLASKHRQMAGSVGACRSRTDADPAE